MNKQEQIQLDRELEVLTKRIIDQKMITQNDVDKAL